MELTALLLMLVVASSAPLSAQPVPTQPPSVTENNLYIYRKYAEPTVFAATVKVDGSKIAALGNKQYIAVHVAPGEHTIDLTWPMFSGQHATEFAVTVPEGKRVYLQINGISRVVGVFGNLLETKVGSQIAEIDPEKASSIVDECCQLKN